jgi:hypothetical protein
MQKRAAKRDRGPKWSSPKQDDRNRPKVSLTVSPEGKAALAGLAVKLAHKMSAVAEACVVSQAEAARSPAVLADLKRRCDAIKADQSAAKRRR